MARTLLDSGKETKTRQLARRMIDGQQKNIAELDALLAQRGGAEARKQAQGRRPEQQE